MRRAFTLIELVMVVAIIGILLALLLPAVQAAREAGRRVHCANNLRQLAIAMHLHEDVNGVLPAGATSFGPQFSRMTWITRCLPYIEQTGLWDISVAAWDYQPSPFFDPPHIGFSTPLAVLACPSDGRPAQAWNTHQGYRVAVTSYVGVLGTAWDQPDGVLFLDAKLNLSGILDGTSNTLLVGERPPSPDFWYGWWYSGMGQATTGSLDSLLGVREKSLGGLYVQHCPPGPYHFAAGHPDEMCDSFHYWSFHPSGAHFAFADASVHFITYSGDGLLPALATRGGREPAGLP